MESTDVPLYLHPVQAVFFALLPLAVFDALGTVAANFLAERRRGGRRPGRLLVAGRGVGADRRGLRAAGVGGRGQPTGPGVGEDWIATGLIWATVICGCAALMAIGRAVPVGAARPAWLARGRAAQLEN